MKLDIYSIGVIGTFILYIVVGSWAGRRVKTQEDYYVVGRNAPTILIVGTLVSSFLSTVAFMGETGFSYDGYVIPLLIITSLNACGYITGALFFGRYLRRSRALTVPEYFGLRFNSRKLQQVAGITTIIGIGGYLVAVTQGASILMAELLGIDYWVALLVVWFVYTSYTFYAGSPGVLITDTIMFFFFAIVTFMAVPYIFGATGGWSRTIGKLVNFAQKPDMISWHGLSGANAYMGTSTEVLAWAITMGLVWAAVVAVSPWQSSRYLMAKSEHVTLRSAMAAGVVYMILYLALHFSAVAINLVNPNIIPSEKAYIWATYNIMPAWLGMLVLGGIMAAAISSCCTFLSLVGFAVSRDVLSANEDEKKALRASRITMLVVGLMSLVITYFQPPAVMWIGYLAATVFAASWGPMAFMSVWSKRITSTGAMAGMISGFLVVCIAEALKKWAGFHFPFWFSPPIIGVLASFLAIWIGSVFTKVTEEEKIYRQNLFVVPSEEFDPKEIAITKRYPKFIMGIGVMTIICLYLFYLVPFTNAITGK